MDKKTSLRPGEKILFGMTIIFIIVAVIAYVILETVRLRSDKPLFETKTHFNLSAAGHRGSELFRKMRCTSCHRAMRNGTNMGLSLDGTGSKRTREWVYDFLRDPEAIYGSQTVDHGYPPKEAAYVSNIPREKLMDIATFLSELKSEQGSSSAPMPPEGRSEFIDSMVGTFAPAEWKTKYKDVRSTGDDEMEENSDTQ